MNLSWIAILPPVFRRRLEGRHDFQTIIANTGWLFADKLLRMCLGLFVGVWLARYLGPQQYGQFNFAISYVSLFGTIAGMGLNGIVVRNIVREPAAFGNILGTAFILQLFGSFVSLMLIIGSFAYLRPDDTLTRSMVAVLGMSLVLKSTDVVRYWFESRVQSRYTVWVENGAFAIMACFKITMILNQASLMVFVWLIFAEAALVAVGLLVVYAKNDGHICCWKPSFSYAMNLLNDCWPLIFSSIAVMIYLRIDQIMLVEMTGETALGIYSAAVNISEIWYFVPVCIVASIMPSLISARNISQELYEVRLHKLYEFMVILAVSIAIPMTVLSDVVILTVYGSEFTEAGTVLSINIWSGVFVFLGTACGIYTNIENLPRYSLLQTVLGMLTNIALNILMIPLWGAKGAALSTVVSYAVATFSVLLFSRTRQNGLAMLRALNIVRSIRCYRGIHL